MAGSSKNPGGEEGSTLNLGSGCDCSFQVFCVKDSDCSSKSNGEEEVEGQKKEHPNCKMDCCGARCEKGKSLKSTQAVEIAKAPAQAGKAPAQDEMALEQAEPKKPKNQATLIKSSKPKATKSKPKLAKRKPKVTKPSKP